MITKYAIKHLNGTILKTTVCSSIADETRDHKKSQASISKDAAISNLNEEINKRLEGITDQIEIDAINSELTLRLAEINAVYDGLIQEADATFDIEIATIIPEGFVEVPKVEFDKIDVKEYVYFDDIAITVSNKVDRVTIESTYLNSKRISDIKNEASKIITNRLPEWKQRNYIARMTELLLNMQTVTLSQAEQDELLLLQGEWNWVKSVRQTSNDAETNGTLLKDIIWP